MPRGIYNHWKIRGENNPAKRKEVRLKLSLILKNRKITWKEKLRKPKKDSSKMYKFQKGHIPWNKGKLLPIKVKEKISKSLLGHKYPIERNEKIALINRKKVLLEGMKLKNTGRTWFKKGHTLWQNPIYREKVIKNSLKALFKRPTSLEKEFIVFVKEHNLPYKYVGDGSFLIGFKNPDFIDTNGKKICIELRPKIMCQFWNKCSPEEYEGKQIEHYLKYGWKCIVVWQEDFLNGCINIAKRSLEYIFKDGVVLTQPITQKGEVR